MSSETIYAILVGLIIGLVFGLLKTWLLWFRGNPFKAKNSEQPSAQGLVNRSLLSYFLTVIILGLIYLLHFFIPLPLTPFILAAAAALLASNLIYPLQSMFRK